MIVVVVRAGVLLTDSRALKVNEANWNVFGKQ